VAYKIEDNIDKTERLKKRQDYLVSQLTEEKMKIQEEKKLLQEQYQQQLKETKNVQEIL
jgi:hypothetical protein